MGSCVWAQLRMVETCEGDVLTITVDNSYSQITGLSPKQEKELKELLSYDTGAQAAFFSGGYGPRRKSLLSKRGDFPTGLLPKVVESYPGAVIQDFRVKPPRNGIRAWLGPKPYAAQETAVTAAIAKHRGCISMPTGSGKSLVIAKLVSELNVDTLVVVPSLEIKKQLTEAIEGFLGPKNRIDVENIDSVDLKNARFPSYGCLIIDEAHHVAARTYQKLNKTAWAGIYYRFFMTATPFRNNTEETLLFEAIAGQVIYELSYKDAVKAGYIVPVEAYYLEIPKVDCDVHTYQQVYSQLVVNHEERNTLIAYTMLKLNAAGKSTLCLVKEVSHGKKITDKTGFDFANGADDASRKFITLFNLAKINALTGTTGILGEGVDTKPCEFVIIAGLGKAKSAFLQQVGRAVRRYGDKESAKVIIIKDRSHKFTLRHFNAQVKILKEYYGVTPMKLDL